MAILGTQSLTQLVRLRPDSTGTVDARQAFLEPDLASRLQRRFVPLSTQVDALKAAAETAREGGSILLAGAAGTGKSLLLLLLGKALSVTFPGDEFTALADRVRDAHAVRALAALRSAGRRWLVVLPEAGPSEDFDSAVRRALNGALFNQGVADFAPPPGRLRDEFAQTGEHLQQRGGFDGIAVLFDRMDELVAEVLEDEASPVAAQVADFRDFCRTSSFPVFFTGLVDREMSLYSLDQETRLLHLFSRVQPVSLLGRTGEWEELVGQVLLEHPEGETWSALQAHPDLRAVRDHLSRIGLYQGTSDRWLTEVVMEGAYPLHPAALFALPRLAPRLATRGRTAFTFFADSSPGGLLYFLKNFAVAQPNGRLSLYTADSLFTHFERALEGDPLNQEYLQALQKAVLAAGDIPQARRLLRMVLVFQMVGHDRLRSRADDLIWALHLGEREVRIARRSLELLVQKKALRYSEATEEFLLPLELKPVSLEESLARTRNRVRTELDILGILQGQVSLPRLEARSFNREHGTDRAAFSRMVLASELKDPASFHALVDGALGQVRPYHGDLVVAWVVAETPEELESVQALAEAGALDHPQAILALPGRPHSFTREALEVMALERLRALEPPFSDPTSPEHQRVTDLLQAAQGSLRSSLEQFMALGNLRFRTPGRLHADLDAEGLADLADRRIAELIGAPPAVAEPSLSCLRDPGRARRQRQAALNHLLACRGELALRADAGVPRRVLEAGLVDSGILELTRRVGNWAHYDLVQTVPDRGLGKAFRFLQERLVGGAGEDRTVEAAEVVLPLLRAPYSLTPAMVELLLAVVLWKWPQELRLRKNCVRARLENRPDLLEAVPATAQALFDLVGGPVDWSFRYADAEPAQRDVLQGMLELLAPEGAPEAPSLWTAASRALVDWYGTLAPAARAAGATGDPVAEALRTLLEDPAARADARALVEVRLPKALGLLAGFSWEDEGPELLERLARARQAHDRVVSARSERLQADLALLFSAHAGGDGELSWVERGRRWLASVAEDLESSPLPAEYPGVARVLEGASDPVGAVDDLLVALGYPTLAEGRLDASVEVLERLRTMRELVEWGPYRNAHSAAGQDAEALVLGLVRPVLTRACLPCEALEPLLIAELELAVWPESVHREAPPVVEGPPVSGAEVTVEMEVTEAWATSAPEAAAGAEPVAAATSEVGAPDSRLPGDGEADPSLQWL